jgi:very-short-patch-repair endonuclease
MARRLRREPTDAETRLWRHLRQKSFQGLKFRRQVTIGADIADFACFERNLVIEVDGGQHDSERPRDEARTRYLERQGWRVFRCWNNDVLSNTEGVLEMIGIELARFPHPDPPSQAREGADRRL